MRGEYVYDQHSKNCLSGHQLFNRYRSFDAVCSRWEGFFIPTPWSHVLHRLDPLVGNCVFNAIPKVFTWWSQSVCASRDAIGIVLAVCVGAPWEYTHFIQPLPRDGLLAWVGVTVSVFSVFLLTMAMWKAGNLYGIRRNQAGDTYLVSGGPYRYVRHPGYLSGVLFIMGIALSLSSLIAWFAFVLATAYSIFRIRKDEEKLEQIFTEAFTNYRVRTRWMLFPGIF